VLVDALPRNETGKLVRATLKALYEAYADAHRDPNPAALDGGSDHRPSAHGGSTPSVSAHSASDHSASDHTASVVLAIDADHPAYAGHFPGRPVLPGVVLLDAALTAIGDTTGQPLHARALASAKFLSPVTPGETLILEHRATPSGAIEFTISANARVVARGTVAL
jgi:3-hydroxymyristoyl/3-hydroxydecanoyl-(acyl carrier protein) dehydratase